MALLGIDVGTTNIKAAIFDETGQCLAIASLPTVTHVPRTGWAFHRPEELWRQTVDAIRAALRQVPNRTVQSIEGIAVASVGEAGVPLDKHGEPTYDVIAWFDRRPIPQIERLEARFGQDRLFAISGLSLQPIWTLCKILWLRDEEPDAFARTVHWLLTADYIAYRLCGERATDFSLASRTLAFDVQARSWHHGLLADIGVPPSLFAPPVPSGHRLGTVTDAAAAETGLPSTAVVSAGGHDHVVGALGAGITSPGQMLNSIGTAEALLLPTSEPILDAQYGADGYTQGCHVIPDTNYVVAGHVTAGAAVNWAHEVIGGGADLASLITEAEAIPPGSNGAAFLPHLRLSNPPVVDPRTRGAFVGLHSDTKRAALFRAVLEGLVLETRQSLSGMLRYPGVPSPDEIIAIGGGARNRLLMAIKASAFKMPIRVIDVPEAAALGAALLGGVGAGVYRDAFAAAAELKHSATVVMPDPVAAEQYDRIYDDIYTRLYPAVRHLNHAIDSVQRDFAFSSPVKQTEDPLE